MKPTTILSTALFALTASASWLGNNEQKALDDKDDKAVPGKNPLAYCAKPDDYLLSIDNVDLDPNPPQAGKSLNITATGLLSERVEKGAKAHLSVKYGLIKILTQEVDLCEQSKEVDEECPIQKGDLTLSKKVELPVEIPPGKYTVLADVLTKDKETITCLEATVVFHRGGGMSFFGGGEGSSGASAKGASGPADQGSPPSEDL